MLEILSAEKGKKILKDLPNLVITAHDFSIKAYDKLEVLFNLNPLIKLEIFQQFNVAESKAKRFSAPERGRQPAEHRKHK